MKRLCNVKLISAAIAAASMIAVPAFGQVRVGQDGHSNDASNRVGSGGYNSPGTVYSTGISQNNIIYNNITGLGGFSGPIREVDPSAFFGPSGSTLSDNFIRTSSGVPTSYQASSTTLGNTPTAFFGQSREVAPPIGTERLGFTGSYIGTNYTPADQYNNLNSQITSSLDLQRQQLGTSTVLGVGSTALDNGNPASQIDQGGPLDAISGAGNYVGSPLYGLQGMGNQNGLDATDFGLPVFATPSSSSTGTARFRSRSTTEIDRMQNELMQTDDQDQLNGLNAGTSANGQQAQSPDALNPGNLARSIDSPNNRRLNSSQANSALGGSTLGNGVNSQGGTQQRSTVLMTPQQQSAQYNILSQRLLQLTNPQVAQLQDAAAIQNRVVQARMKQDGVPGVPGPTSRPAFTPGGIAPGGAGPGGFQASGASSFPKLDYQPLQVESLANGITAKGLHDLLSDAEKLMKDGKFESAIKKYNTAERVAPNNGLVPLGRANAELGAGYYYQASADLHQVFEADPALLLGQYDLKKWMGEKRLAFITNELRELSSADPKQETPAFLLAYISYNTGEEGQAAIYLHEANTRSNGRDPLLSQLESHWKFDPAGLNGSK